MPGSLASLERVVQELAQARNLAQMARAVVQRTRQEMEVDICSLYIASPATDHLRLLATTGAGDGVDDEIDVDVGLPGLVARTAELVNLVDAPAHPSFTPLSVDDPAPCTAFLGVPVVYQRRVRGVLIVKHGVSRRFNSRDEAFLSTLAAQLGGAIALAEATGKLDRPTRAHVPTAGEISGRSGTGGTALGTGVVVARPRLAAPRHEGGKVDPEREIESLRAAIAATTREIEEIRDFGTGGNVADRYDILTAYLGILDSPELADGAVAAIRTGQPATEAWSSTVREFEHYFANAKDPYLRERGRDIRQIGAQVLARLIAGEPSQPVYPRHTVLVGEVGVLDFAKVPEGQVVAIVCAHGSAVSHVAMLAGALGIPSVVGVGDLPWSRLEGRTLLVDGDRGQVYLDPDPELIDEHRRRVGAHGRLKARLESMRDRPAVTTDGEAVEVCANTGMLRDAAPVLRVGADGIGLYRSEYTFMAMERFPSEAEQYEVYRQVLETLAPRSVTLRTLDVGADKPLPYFPVREDNPALGWRGVRVTLDHPEIFLTQIRAAMRASQGLHNLRLLLPMISRCSELADCLQLIRQAHRELTAEGLAIELPPVGVMVEVPSAVHLASALLRQADFLSVGTNDLTQYVLAADRNNERVAPLADSLHPAVLDAIDRVARAALAADKPVAVCGAMAGDPLAVVALLGMGIRTLSVPTARVLAIKHVVRSLSVATARGALAEVFALEDADGVRAVLRRIIDDAGLSEVVVAIDGDRPAP